MPYAPFAPFTTGRERVSPGPAAPDPAGRRSRSLRPGRLPGPRRDRRPGPDRHWPPPTASRRVRPTEPSPWRHPTVPPRALPKTPGRRSARHPRRGTARRARRRLATLLPRAAVAVAIARGRRGVAGAAGRQQERRQRQQGDGGDVTYARHADRLHEGNSRLDERNLRAACNQPSLGPAWARAVARLWPAQRPPQKTRSDLRLHPLGPTPALVQVRDRGREAAGRVRISRAAPSPADVTGPRVGPRCPTPRRPPPGSLRRGYGW